MATEKPNVVLILADDLGYVDLGVHGCKDIPTPNIDSIAKDGVRFTDAYANGSFCTPTRAALMCGRYQHRYGVEDLNHPLPAVAKTLAERPRAADYRTAMVGKWHLGSKKGFVPIDRGFDEFFGFVGGGHVYESDPNGKGEYHAPILRGREAVAENRYLTDAFGDEAADFLGRQRKSDKPCFLYVAFNAVHTPLQATEKYESRFPKIVEKQRRTYAAVLLAMDDAVGKVLSKLDSIGKRNETLVIFANDNGGPTTRNAVNGSSNAPFRGSKCETFEGGIRIPMFLRWPGKIEPGTTYAHQVATFDLTATTLAAAGGDTKELDGVDLLPFVKGNGAASPHEALLWRGRTMSNNYAIRMGDWKFVHSTEGAAGPGPKQTPAREMLFNLKADPRETRDLAVDQPAKLSELKKRYEAWSNDVDADCRKNGLRPAATRQNP